MRRTAFALLASAFLVIYCKIHCRMVLTGEKVSTLKRKTKENRLL